MVSGTDNIPAKILKRYVSIEIVKQLFGNHLLKRHSKISYQVDVPASNKTSGTEKQRDIIEYLNALIVTPEKLNVCWCYYGLQDYPTPSNKKTKDPKIRKTKITFKRKKLTQFNQA